MSTDFFRISSQSARTVRLAGVRRSRNHQGKGWVRAGSRHVEHGGHSLHSPHWHSALFWGFGMYTRVPGDGRHASQHNVQYTSGTHTWWLCVADVYYSMPVSRMYRITLHTYIHSFTHRIWNTQRTRDFLMCELTHKMVRITTGQQR